MTRVGSQREKKKAIFPVTTLGLDLFLGTYLNKFTVFRIPSDRK